MRREASFRIDGLTLTGWLAADSAPLMLIHAETEEARQLLPGLEGCDIGLAAIAGLDWDRDLSPWPLRLGRREIAGGGEAHLARLNDVLLPQMLARWSLRPAALWLMGYSLAGLFALYAGLSDARYEAVASVSGSLWAPEFPSFAKNARVAPRRVYLSLGDAESRARNPMLACVGENTAQFYALLKARGIHSFYEMNAGGHFSDSTGRMLRAVRWLRAAEPPSAP